jgi:poly-gamma-glutamate synthesis protein (capsule biosynthesis protein)
MLGRGVSAELSRRSPESFWANVLPVLHSADAVVANLECAVTARTQPWQKIAKGFHFRADPRAVEVLRAARIRCVRLANNHTLDFGEEGLLDTLRHLDSAGIRHVGAGSNQAAAEKPALLDAAGLKVGIIAFTDHEAASAAGAACPGTNFVDIATDTATRTRVARAAAQARQAGAEFIVLSLHWGPNMRLAPSPVFRAFAHAAVEDGVHLIYGHSAHTFQGVELYQQGLILYDTGDFLDDYAVDPILRHDWSFVFLVSVDAEGLHSLRTIPIRQDDARANLAAGADFEAIVERMRRKCSQLGTPVRSTPEGLELRLRPGGQDTASSRHTSPERQRGAALRPALAGASGLCPAVKVAPLVADDAPLARLLDPVDVNSFMARFWERASLYIPGGATKFADLFSRSEFFRAVGQRLDQGTSRPLGRGLRLNAGYQGADGNHYQLGIEPEQIRPLLEAGLTIQAEGMHTAEPALEALARALKEQIRIPGEVDVAAFLSPAGGGYGLHYDAVMMCVLQIAGAKRWWYSPEPVTAFPQANRIPTAQEREQGVDGLYRAEDMQEQLLSPGDVLYLPAGTWHRVRAEGESLHLCLTVRYCDFLQLVTAILSPTLLSRADWRHLPMLPATPGDLDEMDPRLEELFAGRLLEFRAALDALMPIDLFRAWRDRALAF